jgi:hypothetical protein
MNRNQFISFMDNPDKLSVNDGILLAELVKNFPYFQTAHLLFAKSLHNQHSIHYNNQLKISATYATDRKVLHHLITYKPEQETGIVKEQETVQLLVIEDTLINAERIATNEGGQDDSTKANVATGVLEANSFENKNLSEPIENGEKITEETTLVEEIVVEQRIEIEAVAEIEEENIELKESIPEKTEINEKGSFISEEIIEQKIEIVEKNNDVQEFLLSPDEKLITDIQKDSDNGVFENSDELISDELEIEYLAQAAISKIELEVLNTELFREDEKTIVSKNEYEPIVSGFILNTPIEPIDSGNTKVSETGNAESEALSALSTHFDSSQTHSFTEWLKNTSNTTEIPLSENKSAQIKNLRKLINQQKQ